MSDNSNNEKEDEEKSFAELFEESFTQGMKEALQVGDKIRGEIISIGRDSVFVDTGTKIDGVVDKGELLDENQELPHKVGDLLELYVVAMDGGEVRLSRALSGVGGLELLRDAFEAKIPVEGKVKTAIKGGFQVEVMQRRSFCPISQMDLKFVEKPENYLGQTLEFLITQFEENGRNIVVSRRELLDRELEKARKAFLEGLAIGSVLEGRVKRLMPYGAFVELFPGIEGMVHISEVSWSRVEKPGDVLGVEDAIEVKVIGLEQPQKPGPPKIALSVKQVTGDPWDKVKEKFKEGDKVSGKVIRCADFGAFVEIAPGIEGLVHLSEMSYKKRVSRPEEIVDVGESVYVAIKEIDTERKRISMSLREIEGDPWISVKSKYRPGQLVRGTLESKESFGCFVSLEPGITGLLPKSKIKESTHSAVIDKLKRGDSISVIIEDINEEDRRITLSPGDSRDEGDWKNFMKAEGQSMGSLGEKLRAALKSKKSST